MRAGRIGRTAGRAVAIALFGLAVTVAGVVGVQASEPDDYVWDGAGTQSTGDNVWGRVIDTTAETASDYVWD